MSETSVQKALQSFGLTEKESQIYICLARNGIQKGVEIAKKTKTAKAVVYRTLKILQRKGFIESSLESPIRHTAIPFETVLESQIRAKQEEAKQIETVKENLLADWRKIRKGQSELPIEKFVVLEGTKKIYSKIFQMIKQTKSQLSIIATIDGIIRADRYGIIREINNHPLRYKIKIRFLTDLTDADIASIRFLRKQLRHNALLRGRNPELGERPFPRMVIRDQEEILFFITPNVIRKDVKTDETSIVTNCKSMIQTFSDVFEDLWENSTEIQEKIAEIKSGRLTEKTLILNDAEKARALYYKVLDAASEEVFTISSTDGFIVVGDHISQLEDLTRRGLRVKVMAPITNENLTIALELMQSCCEVRHIPLGYFDTVIIDRQHLFQFNTVSTGPDPKSEMKAFEKVFYTTDLGYIQKTTKMLYDLWRKTRSPSNSSMLPFGLPNEISNKLHGIIKEIDRYGFPEIKHAKESKISETDLQNKISEAKNNPSKYLSRNKWSDTLYFFGSRAFAHIRPPKTFNLPEMIIAVFKNIECSAFGPENSIKIYTKPEKKPTGPYQLVAQIQDNPKSMDYNLNVFEGMPIRDNIKLVKKDQINVVLQGSTLFAGWTVPIFFSGSRYVLPPSCILFEAFGKVKSGIFDFVFPSGRKQEVWFNNLEAFVAYFHQKSKYVGPGNEGILDRESMQISYPP